MVRNIDFAGESTQNIKLSVDHLTEFESTVNKVIEDLRAGFISDKPAGEPLQPGAYGKGFQEAALVDTTLATVVGHLERLSKVLHAQIEAMKLTVRMASDKTQEADETNKAEMARIFQEIRAGAAPRTATQPARDVG